MLTIVNYIWYTVMRLAVILATATIFLATLLPTRATAQESDYVCYWRKPDGTLTDLGLLCRQPTTTTRLSGDAAFLADFQSKISQYPASIRQELEIYINQNKDSAIASAKVTCRVLRFGGTDAQAKRREKLASNNLSPTEEARLQIVQPLAINYYCPEFASR